MASQTDETSFNTNQSCKEENAEKDLVHNLKTKYNNVKKSFLEIAEELKMRRLNDQVHEDKINKLITEKFELKRVKEEDLSTLNKNLEILKQEKMQLEKDLNEKSKLHEEEKNTHNISLSSSSKGVKALKDEILALQLIKYSLEKKIKEQDHQIQLERSSNEEMTNHLSDCRAATESARKQFAEVEKRLNQLSDIVTKTDDVHKKLIQVNQHHKCVVENYKSERTKLSGELASIKAQYAQLKDQLNRNQDGGTSCEKDRDESMKNDKLKELERSNEQLQKEVDTIRVEKKNLLIALSDSTELHASLKLKYGDAIKSNELYQLELDEEKTEIAGLKKENVGLKNDIDALKKEIKDKESAKNNLEAKYEVKLQSLEESLKSLHVENEKQLLENRRYLTRLTDLKKQNEKKEHTSRLSQTEDAASQQEEKEEIVWTDMSLNDKHIDSIPCDEKIGNEVCSDLEKIGIKGDACDGNNLQIIDHQNIDQQTSLSKLDFKADLNRPEATEPILIETETSDCTKTDANLCQLDTKRRIEDAIYDGNITKQRKVEILSSKEDCLEEKSAREDVEGIEVTSVCVKSSDSLSPAKNTSTLSTSEYLEGASSSCNMAVAELDEKKALCNRVSFAENALLIIDTNPENCRDIDSTLNTVTSILK